MPPLPEGLQRAFVPYSRCPTSLLASSPIAAPGEEGLEEADRLFGVGEPVKTFDGVVLAFAAEPGEAGSLLASVR